jgi:hypothetical protein
MYYVPYTERYACGGTVRGKSAVVNNARVIREVVSLAMSVIILRQQREGS